MKNVLCIFHAGCVDGFTSAWIMARALHGKARVTLYGGVYGKPPPYHSEVKQFDQIYMVDFSYPRADMEALLLGCPDITVFDHHDTAEQVIQPMIDEGKIRGVFDQTRCGSTITWDQMMAEPRPALLEYIQDWDIHTLKLPDVREVTRAIRQYAHKLEVWDVMMRGQGSLDVLRHEGSILEPYHRKQVESVKRRAVMAELGRDTDGNPYCVPVAQGLPELASEVAGELCTEHGFPFAAMFYMANDGSVVYQLRSGGDNAIHVGEFARDLFGGGGHPNAAGFTAPTLVHSPLGSLADAAQ